jgi:hypothetical protein
METDTNEILSNLLAASIRTSKEDKEPTVATAVYHCPTCKCPETELQPQPELTIADYYVNKRKEAALAKASLDFHKKTCEAVDCKRCRQLEKRLVLARYVGD